MTDTAPRVPQRVARQVIAAIRKTHLKANIGWIERKGPRPTHPSNGRRIVIRWRRAWLDEGGTIFGQGPYLHVPIFNHWGTNEETVHRVYPPERLRKQLAQKLARHDSGK